MRRSDPTEIHPPAGSRRRSVWPPPIWLMRQAGRYLPEYRESRAEAGSFLDLCYTPRLAAEVTLQPIRRFGFDAAIMFSDILVVPHALGQEVALRRERGSAARSGPHRADLDRLADEICPSNGSRRSSKRSTGSRRRCPCETALLGFCGAPWTVASYMIAGKGTPDQAPARARRLSRSGFHGGADRPARRRPPRPISSARSMRAPTRCRSSRVSARPCRRPCSSRCRSARSAASSAAVKAARPKARVIVFVRGGGAHLHRFAEAGIADALGARLDARPARVLPTLPAASRRPRAISIPSPCGRRRRRSTEASTTS